MTDVTNDDRADWAESSAQHYGQLTNMDRAGEDLKTMLQDLQASIVHLCRREGISFHELVIGAEEVAAEEVAEANLIEMMGEDNINDGHIDTRERNDVSYLVPVVHDGDTGSDHEGEAIPDAPLGGIFALLRDLANARSDPSNFKTRAAALLAMTNQAAQS